MNVGGAIFGFVIQSLCSKIASRRGDTRRTGAILVARKSHAFRALKLLLANYPKAVHRKARPDTSCIEARGLRQGPRVVPAWWRWSRSERCGGGGHSIFIDDFGTGYSSLSYLLYLSVDTIKIDKAFTRAIGTESVTVAILPQIMAMAKSLNLEVVVEGIETEHQALYFSTKPRVFGQGWLYGRPVSAEEFHCLMAEKDLVPNSLVGARIESPRAVKGPRLATGRAKPELAPPDLTLAKS